MDDPEQSEQAFDDSSAYGEPVVGGWGDTYGDAPVQDEQSLWDDVTEWVEELTDDTPTEDSSGSGGGISGLIENTWRPVQEHIDRRNELEANHRAVFRGRLNSAIQATELLGPESSFDEVLSASGTITTAANTAYVAADELDRDTPTGGRYAHYHGTLAWAASELESVAMSDSEAARQYSIPTILSTLRDVGNDSESLY